MRPHPAWQNLLFWCGVAAVVLLLYLPHLRAARSPYVFNNDARQFVVAFYPFFDASLMPGDEDGEYYRRAILPTGYRLLYRALAEVVDPALASRALPYALMAVFAAALGRAAYAAGGLVASWAVVVCALSAELFFKSMGGGHAHGFAFALMGLVVLALVTHGLRLLALTTVLGAAFYPMVALVAGATLAALLLAPRAFGHTGSPPPLGRRLALLAATAGIAAAVALPQITASRSYGPLTPVDAAAYPELSDEGRYHWAFTPSWAVPQALVRYGAGASRRIFGSPAAALVLFGALLIAARRDMAARRLLLLVVAGAGCWLAANLLAPYLYFPGRYLRYVVPTALVAALPFALRPLLASRARLGPAGRALPAAVAAGFTALALLGPDRVTAQTGQGVDVRADAPFYRFVASLPPDATLAGWPRGRMDNVPYVARRRVLVSYETHQVFHLAYVEEMRRRMRALIEAYFALDPAPLVALREEFGVDLLVVEERHLRGAAPPRYFAPFDAWTAAVWRCARRDPRGFQVLRLAPDATVFRHRDARVVDLRRVSPAPPGDAPAPSCRVPG